MNGKSLLLGSEPNKSDLQSCLSAYYKKLMIECDVNLRIQYLLSNANVF